MPSYEEEHKIQHLFIKLHSFLQKNILFKSDILKIQQELLTLAQYFKDIINSDYDYIINPQSNTDLAKFKLNYL